MNQSELLHYKNLLLEKQQELSAGKSIVGSIPAVSEPCGDPADMAVGEISAAVQVRVKQTNGKLSRAIEDALTRIRQERFGICEECGEPISRACLEVVPWTRHCKDCKERQDSGSCGTNPRGTVASPFAVCSCFHHDGSTRLVSTPA
jgi:DnaK suppressor protein